MIDARVVVERFLETFSTGDIPAILDMMTDDATWWVAGSVAGISGCNDKDTLGTLLREVRTVYAEGRLQITPVSMIVEGASVACEATSHALLWDGRTYANQYHFRFETRDGKIGSVREYSDTQHMVDTFAQ